MDKMQKALEILNANPCTAWDPAIFPRFNEEELRAAQRSWHAAIYAAALAFSSVSAKAWQQHKRFEELRAAYPDVEADEIWLRIHDEEVEQAEAEEGRRILSHDESRFA